MIKLNNRGQTLILFIIFIPLLLMLAAFIVDTGLILKASSKLESTSKTIIESAFKNPENSTPDKIKELYQKNNIPIDNLEITITEDIIMIKNNYEVESAFGSLIGIKTYEIKINITGKKENDTIIFNTKKE